MARPKFNDNRTRFKVLAEERTNNVLKAIRILSGCRNKYLYTFKEEEIEKIFKAINEAVIESKAQFQLNKNKKFRLF